MRIWCGLIVGIALITLGGPRAFAERLPARAYTTADGLGHDRVLCVVQDSRGILWFCTVDGLSRFDGHSFVNYGERQGLPGVPVYSFIESRPGVYLGRHAWRARALRCHPRGRYRSVRHPRSWRRTGQATAFELSSRSIRHSLGRWGSRALSD